jgi:magnesium transporter
VDDILDVIEEETTEDMSRMAGVMDTPDARYLSTSVWQHVKSRLPWLIFLTMSYMITSLIIQHFEDALSKIITLVAYMPLLMGTGGNSGAQASTLIIRGMALGDVELKDVGRVLWKEFRISILVGSMLALFNFAKVLLIDGNSWIIALTISLAMLIIVIFAKVVGSTLPIAAKKCGIDPALMANPVIASITDMFSATIYLLLATMILGI